MIKHFHAPANVRAALKLRRGLRGRVVYLAGGTWVNSPDCQGDFEHCINLAGLGLDRVSRTPKGLAIGAMCTLQRLADTAAVPAPLKAALAQVVNRNVRNAATLGGHVVAAQQPSDLLPMLVALDARVQVVLPGGTKTLPLMDYMKSAPAGLLTALVLPPNPRGRVAACRNLRASAHARSLLSVAVSGMPTRAGLVSPIIALSGVAAGIVRLAKVEALLAGKPLPPADELQAIVSAAVKPKGDAFASAEFRRYEAGALVAIALHAALGAKGGRS